MAIYKSGVVSGAARDSTNTPTTVLRAGLVVGIITASGKFTNYDAAATDGSQFAVGVLAVELRAQDFDATNADRSAPILVGGPVRAGRLLGLDQYSRAQLERQFLFDDDLVGNRHPYPRVVAKTTSYTVTAADRGTLFTNQGAAGAVTFTLPTIARGLYYSFFVEADQNVIVASAVGDIMVVFNDATADSVAFQTAGEKIGSSVTVFANADGTKWLAEVHLAAETVTPTIAT